MQHLKAKPIKFWKIQLLSLDWHKAFSEALKIVAITHETTVAIFVFYHKIILQRSRESIDVKTSIR